MLETLKEIMLEYVDVPADSITPDTRFLADLAMNSLDIMTMVGEIEDRFNVEIPTEDLGSIYTVQDLLDYLQEKVA